LKFGKLEERCLPAEQFGNSVNQEKLRFKSLRKFLFTTQMSWKEALVTGETDESILSKPVDIAETKARLVQTPCEAVIAGDCKNDHRKHSGLRQVARKKEATTASQFPVKALTALRATLRPGTVNHCRNPATVMTTMKTIALVILGQFRYCFAKLVFPVDANYFE
jgi:hypothetical protein